MNKEGERNKGRKATGGLKGYRRRVEGRVRGIQQGLVLGMGA